MKTVRILLVTVSELVLSHTKIGFQWDKVLKQPISCVVQFRAPLHIRQGRLTKPTSAPATRHKVEVYSSFRQTSIRCVWRLFWCRNDKNSNKWHSLEQEWSRVQFSGEGTCQQLHHAYLYLFVSYSPDKPALFLAPSAIFCSNCFICSRHLENLFLELSNSVALWDLGQSSLMQTRGKGLQLQILQKS